MRCWSKVAGSVLLAAGASVGCQPRGGTAAVAPQYFAPPPRPDGARLPFSEAVRAGDFLFVAGQVGAPPGTLDIVTGGIEAEAEQVLGNMKALLERHGTSLEHVVQCTVYLVDLSEWAPFNSVYTRFFTQN